MTPPYIAACDLGQIGNYSTLIIAQRKLHQFANVQDQHYFLRHIERFPLSTPYGGRCLHGVSTQQPCAHCPRGVSIGGVVEQVRARLKAVPLPDAWTRAAPISKGNLMTLPNPQPPFDFLIDCTGVGHAVGDMFLSYNDLWPIRLLITGGNAVTEPEPDVWHIAKRQLISPLQVVLQTRRLHVLDDALGQALKQECTTFRYKMNAKTGDEQYAAWREGEMDDLVLTAAMIAWWGEKTVPLFAGSQGQQQYAQSDWHPLMPGVHA